VLASAAEADAAVAELTRAGFGPGDISIVLPGERLERRLVRGEGMIRRGATAGAGAGGVIGAGLGLLTGILLMAVPGAPAIAAWSLVLMATGAGAGMGGLLGALLGLGLPEPRLRKNWGVLVSVRAEDHEGQARAVAVFGRMGVKQVLMGAVM
jgi:hypothetical protein